MGLNASGDEFCQATDPIIKGIPGVTKLVDDILVEAPSLKELVKRLRTLFLSARKHGLTISRQKLRVSREVKFAGFLITSTGIRPDTSLCSAIREFPRPDNIHKLRSFLGLVNQLGGFLPDISHLTTPLRGLLRKDQRFLWLEDHQVAFQRCKDVLTSAPVLQPFDFRLPVELFSDASRHFGLGYLLVQRKKDNGLALIDCQSRSVTPTESRYSITELELLGIVWAVKRSDYFLRGIKHFTIVTDHRPLVGLFRKQLNEIDNPRLLRLREKLLGFVFSVVWTPGRSHQMADALSRSPAFSAPEIDPILPNDPPPHCVAHLRALPANGNLTLAQILDAASQQPYTDLVSAIRNGANPKTLPPTHPALPYSSVWDRLSLDIMNDTTVAVLDGRRLVIPVSCRPRLLELLHSSHAGIVKTRTNAARDYFWPGMNNDVKTLVSSCPICTEYLPSQPQEKRRPSLATSPMQMVSLDLFDALGHQHLAMVDRCTGYLWHFQLRSVSTDAIIRRLDEWFLIFGYPSTIRTDNGPQFRQPFKDYCAQHDIEHETSSPYNPQSNGHAEAAVRDIKHLYLKCKSAKENFPRALSAFNNTPREDGFSPTDLLFRRRLRTALPHHSLIPADVDAHAAITNRVSRNDEKTAQQHAKTKDLPPLAVGTSVVVQDPKTHKWSSRAVITGVRSSGHSYDIRFSNGNTSARNRRNIRPLRAHFAN